MKRTPLFAALRLLGPAVVMMAAAVGLANAGSRSLGDLTPGSADSFNPVDYSSNFPGAYLDGLTYFAIGCQLWKTDGTPSGTALVSDLSSGSCSIGGLVAVNGALLFTRGTELWHSDGTAAGTGVLSIPGFNALATESSGRWPGGHGFAYFIVYGGPSQEEVWGTDGTVAGTARLASGGITAAVAFLPDPGLHTMMILDKGLSSATTTTSATSIGTAFTYTNANGNTPAVLGGKLLFTAREATYGLEPWVSDLTPAGTQLLKDITASGDTSNVVFGPVLNGQLYFKAYDYLWKTDGTPAGTVPLTGPGAVIVQPEIALAGNQVVFPGQQSDGKFYWWRSDGTIAGTGALSATPINSNGSDPVFYFSQRKNDVLYCIFSPVVLTRLTGLTNDVEPVGSCSSLLADERRNLGDIELVATYSDLEVLRDGRPRVTQLAFPPTGASNHPGLPGGSMFYFAHSTVTTGSEPSSMDLTDADAPACSYPGKTVPDNDLTGRTDTLYFPQTMKAGKLRVYLNLPHTYVGDLSATLTHVESGKTVQLFDRMGSSAELPFGCASSDLDVVLDDSASVIVGTGCASDDRSDPQAYPPGTVLRPMQALATFADDNLTGTWQLKVVDNEDGDVGGVDRWCVQNIDRIFFDDFQ